MVKSQYTVQQQQQGGGRQCASERLSTSTHSMDGVLIVSPWKMALSTLMFPSLSFFVKRKIFGSGRFGTKVSRRFTALLCYIFKDILSVHESMKEMRKDEREIDKEREK